MTGTTDVPDPMLLSDGHVMVFMANPDEPGDYESQRVGPDDDDYAYWVAQAQKQTQSPRKRTWPLRTSIAVGLVIAALAIGWISGSFDRVLYPIGLNAHECARNGFGATFCGKELDEYRERIQRAKASTQEAQSKLSAVQHEATEHEQQEHESQQREERTSLESKMAKEKAIYQGEPEGSYAKDLAHDEYESARAQLQQLEVGSP